VATACLNGTGQHQVDHRNTQALLGSRDALVEGIEHLPVIDADVQRVHASQPAPPVSPVRGRVQELALGQVGKVRLCLGQVIRVAHRDQPFIEQLETLYIGGKTPVRQEDRTVVGLGIEVHAVDVHPHAGQLHAAVVLGLLERIQRTQQPAHGQCGRCLQTQAVAVLAQQGAGIFDDLEANLELLRQQAPVLGQGQLRPAAFEQVAAEHGFEGLDVVADGALGQGQLFRGTGE